VIYNSKHKTIKLYYISPHLFYGDALEGVSICWERAAAGAG